MSVAYKDDVVLKQRMELINGQIVMMSPRPAINHSRISGNIFREFSVYLKGKTCEAFGDGVDVYLNKDNRFMPDCMIVCNKDIIKSNGIYGSPDLVVEVLSLSTMKYDIGKKKIAYEKAKVKEYWIVNPFAQTVEVYLNTENGFELDNVYHNYTDKEIIENEALANDDRAKIIIDMQIKVTVCDNLIVQVKDIFEHITFYQK